jgi:peptidoglycan-associated lipoprotein
MTRFAVSIWLAGALAVGCAHEDKKPDAPPKLATEASPAPRAQARPTAPAAEPSDRQVSRDDASPAIFFDFDSSLVREDARPVLQKVGTEIRQRSESLKVEGNCDEVGTVEYNLALGEARARAAKEYLVHLGVPASRIAIASYGSQRPKYLGHDETAHAKNRRDDLLIR